MDTKQFSCPAEGCNRAYASLSDLFQHIVRSNHEISERFLIIDRVTGKVKVMSARAAPAELKEPQEVAA